MAEKEGFEPSESCPSAVFKTAALNHSTISPRVFIKYHHIGSFATHLYKKNNSFTAYDCRRCFFTGDPFQLH